MTGTVHTTQRAAKTDTYPRCAKNYLVASSYFFIIRQWSKHPQHQTLLQE